MAGVRAAVAYDGLGRTFLLRAKLGRRPELLEVLGSQLARVIELSGWAARCSVIVPVPSHPWTDLWRGFSPGAVLARRVGRVLGLPVRPRAVVQRRAGGQAAKRLPAAARRRRSASAFRVRGRFESVSVLLVDDVMTTGASAEACGRALIEAGAREVRVAVWARTLPRGPS